MPTIADLADKKSESAGSPSIWEAMAKYRRLSGTLALTIVPAIFLFVTIQLTNVSGPTWLSSNFENNYPYLFNSLLLIEGRFSNWVDHPGTTTQIFGAAVLRASEPGSSDQIVDAVIGNPEKFIKRIHRTLLFFSTAALWLFPWLTALRIQSYIKALLLQVPSLFFVTLLHYTIWFSSDLMLVPWSVAGLCLSVELVHLRRKGAPQTLPAVLAGIVCALGILTKLTFFPIILIVFVSCRGLRNRLIAGGSFLLAASVVALPIYPRLANLFRWTADLASHTGGYGNGQVGFTQPNILWNGACTLISNEPMILWVPVLATIAALTLHRFRPNTAKTGGEQPIVGLVLVVFGLQVVGFILVAKHAGYHYLIPLYLSTGLNLVLLHEAIPSSKRFSIPAGLGATTLGGLLIWPLSCSTAGTMANYFSLGIWRKQQLSMYDRAKRLVKNDLRIDYFRSSSPEFAAYYGYLCVPDNDDPSGESLGSLLAKRYPRAMFTVGFDPDMKFYTFTQEFDPASLERKYGRFYLFGNHSDGLFNKDHLMPIPGTDQKDIKEIDNGGYIYLDEWNGSDAGSK
jgi:hypothetical protein